MLNSGLTARLAGILFLGFWSVCTMAFNPPEDQTGPVKIRIDAPQEVTYSSEPFAVRVLVENLTASPIRGTLWMKGIDPFDVEPSSDKPVPFVLEAKQSNSFAFTFHGNKPPNNAIYPLHAYARIIPDTTEQVAHAIALVTVLSTSNRSLQLPWKPFEVPSNSISPLLEIPLHRSLIQVTGASLRALPIGFVGEDTTSKAFFGKPEHAEHLEAHSALLIHPPWANGQLGSALIEYPVQLPSGQPIRLQFSNAIRDSAPGEPVSDGVTFRVRIAPYSSTPSPTPVLGDVVFECHTAAKTWQPGETDLSPYAGKAVLIQLESHPGPQNNTTCDASYWADPQLITGTPPVQTETSSPTIHLGSANKYHISVHPGSRGLLNAVITLEHTGKKLAFNGFGIHALGMDLTTPNSTATLVQAELTRPSPHQLQIRHHFTSWRGPFILTGVLSIEDGQVLACQFHLEDFPPATPWFEPKIDDLFILPWSSTANRIYTGVGNVICNPEAFSLPFDGHQQATSYVGYDFPDTFSIVSAVDGIPDRFEANPTKNLYTLHTPMDQTCTLIPEANVWRAAAIWREHCGANAAGGVKALAGRFAFDWWGGNYADSAKKLARSFRYGMTDSIVIWHNWQRWGYDYRLPDICPPNSEYGTQADFKNLIDLCKQNNVLFAVHDNYIDLYPDADAFTYQNIAFTSPLNPQKAWFNEGRGAQAYRWLPGTYEPFMKQNIQWIREHLAPTAYFIDVFSSAAPHDAWSQDGRFICRSTTKALWGETFDYIRETLGGAPQLSESGHDQLIGHLDGAQTNHLRVDAHPPADGKWFVWNVKCTDSERIPWIDMVHHDRFVLHGAGYEPRYCAGLDLSTHGIYSDDYLCTEILGGHPGMSKEPFNREGIRKYWLTHDLMRALALERIHYVDFNGQNIHRQKVKWTTGDVFVNRDETDWEVDGHCLPQYGFYAHVNGVEAALERKKEGLIEWANSPDTVYLNARPYHPAGLGVHVQANNLRFEKDRKITFALQWLVEDPIDADYRVFIHFVDEKGDLIFQGYGELPQPTSQWQGEVLFPCEATLPSECVPGMEYEIRAGLYGADGKRALLEGNNDMEHRVRLGKLRIEGNNHIPCAITWTPFPAPSNPASVRFNMKSTMFDFGGILTDGAVRLTREGTGLRVVVLPGNRAFTLQFIANKIPFHLKGVTKAEVLSEDDRVLRTVPLLREGRYVSLKVEPSAFAYRLIED